MHDDDPGDLGARRVRAGGLRRHPARPPDPRHASSRSRRSSRATIHGYYRRHYTPDNLVVAAAGNVDHDDGRAAGDEGLRAAAGRRRRRPPARSRPAPAAAAHGAARRPPDAAGATEQANLVLGVPGLSPHRRAPLRPRRAQRRPRRRHVVAAVPGGPREARAGVLGLLLHRAVRRRRPVRRLRRLRARQGRPGARPVPRPSCARWPSTASPTRSCAAARASCAASLVLGLEDTGSRMVPGRQGRARLRRGAERRRVARAGSPP